jgi:hypothetical protein
MSNTTIENTEHLLAYIISQADSGTKAWFNYPQQKIVGIFLAVEMARIHADKFTPSEILEYVNELNNQIYTKLILPSQKNYGSHL